MQPSRRGFLRGAAMLLAAPAIVKAASLMPVRASTLQVVPSVGYSSIMEELSAITRRAFVPRLFIQVYHASPVVQALVKDAPLDSDVWFKGAAA